MRWPDRIRGGALTSAMIQGVDWIPTLLEAAGLVRRKASMATASFLYSMVKRMYTLARSSACVLEGSDCSPVHSVRDDRYKLIWNGNSSCEFRKILQIDDKEDYWRSWQDKAQTDENADRLVNRQAPNVDAAAGRPRRGHRDASNAEQAESGGPRGGFLTHNPIPIFTAR